MTTAIESKSAQKQIIHLENPRGVLHRRMCILFAYWEMIRLLDAIEKLKSNELRRAIIILTANA